MIIRPANKSDAPDMMRIRTSVKENTMSEERLIELNINEQSLITQLETTHSGFCAEVDDSVVGFSMGDRTDGSIFALFVSPEFEKSGIGNQLLDAVANDLKLHGYKSIRLSTEPNTRAYDFYLAKGWVHVGFADNGEAMLEFSYGYQ